MDAKSKEELQKLRSDVPQLKRMLEEPFAPSHLGLRRKLQGRLEDEIVRLTELEEMERIETVQHNAVASGLVVTAVAIQEGGECPLCLEEIPSRFGPDGYGRLYRRFYCCGAICCMKCTTDTDRHHETAYDTVFKRPQLDYHQTQEYLTQLMILCRCPFCREICHNEEVRLPQLRRQVSLGKTWARSELGRRLATGICGITKDQSKATELLELAADDGDVEAMMELSLMSLEQYSEDNVGSQAEKMEAYLLRAARYGHVMAQHRVGLASEAAKERDALTWFTLAAAQGFAESQCMLGDLFLFGECCTTESVFTATYWYRKAALQGHKISQNRLAGALLQAKAEIFDGYRDVVGYSAIPECTFWYDISEDAMRLAGYIEERPEPLKVVQCGCCGKRDSSRIEIKRCSKCKAVGYCSRDCQSKHWKMEHKRDCTSVDQWRVAISASLWDSFPYQQDST